MIYNIATAFIFPARQVLEGVLSGTLLLEARANRRSECFSLSSLTEVVTPRGHFIALQKLGGKYRTKILILDSLLLRKQKYVSSNRRFKFSSPVFCQL